MGLIRLPQSLAINIRQRRFHCLSLKPLARFLTVGWCCKIISFNSNWMEELPTAPEAVKTFKELWGLLEIESFITCLGNLCSVLYITVPPMLVRTLEVMNEKHQCTFLFSSVRRETAMFKADLWEECHTIPLTILPGHSTSHGVRCTE